MDDKIAELQSQINSIQASLELLHAKLDKYIADDERWNAGEFDRDVQANIAADVIFKQAERNGFI